jgi:Uma2 family endonuclease
MAVVTQRRPAHMSVELFRTFIEGRPDEEHWELIDGVAMMMAPPTFEHQRIASNLERLLLDALENHDLSLTAYQAIGVNISVEDYDPQPDVVVIDQAATAKPGERYAPRFYLTAEIISPSDRPVSESKRAVYKLQGSCKCVLTIQQDRFDVRVELRTIDGWKESVLTRPEDELVLPEFGLRCKLAELYRGTPLLPRGTSR